MADEVIRLPFRHIFSSQDLGRSLLEFDHCAVPESILRTRQRGITARESNDYTLPGAIGKGPLFKLAIRLPNHLYDLTMVKGIVTAARDQFCAFNSNALIFSGSSIFDLRRNAA